MSNVLNFYLEKIQDTDESVFPIDQFATKNAPLDSSPSQPVDITGKKKKRHLKDVFPENAPPHKKRVMIDFDGTIHQYRKGWDNGIPYDPPFDGARKSIMFLKAVGFEIVIYSARFSEAQQKEQNGTGVQKQIKLIEEWLNKYDIPYDRMTGEKLAAEFYIDDHGVRIENGDWDTVIQFIKERMGLLEEF